MKMFFIMIIAFTAICAEVSIVEQLQTNEQKANVLHKEFMEGFHANSDKEFATWKSQVNEKQRKSLEEISSIAKVNIQEIRKELEKKRAELIVSESKKITDAFLEIKKQGTPDGILTRRAVSMGHTLFHALQKIYKEERERITAEYWQVVSKSLKVVGEDSEKIRLDIEKRKTAFNLEESIKIRTHNLTHTFQVLNEYEFKQQEKDWILDILGEQIKAEEIVRSVREQKLKRYTDAYVEAQRAIYQKQREQQDEALVDKDMEILRIEITQRKTSYDRNLAMYTQRRMANLQREVYYFKGFIDAEIGRYQKSKFPQTVIDNLREKHWKVFLNLTKANFKRWLVEDNIIFVRFMVKELDLYGHSMEEIEKYLLKILK